MDKKLITCFVGLVVTISLSSIHLIAQQRGERPNASAPKPRDSPRSNNPTQREAGTDNQSPAQPPIQITVTTPEPSSADKAKADDQHEREIVAQETVAYFTRVLTFAVILQAIITGFILGASI